MRQREVGEGKTNRDQSGQSPTAATFGRDAQCAPATPPSEKQSI
jgi:hypothetical protein